MGRNIDRAHSNMRFGTKSCSVFCTTIVRHVSARWRAIENDNQERVRRVRVYFSRHVYPGMRPGEYRWSENSGIQISQTGHVGRKREREEAVLRGGTRPGPVCM